MELSGTVENEQFQTRREIVLGGLNVKIGFDKTLHERVLHGLGGRKFLDFCHLHCLVIDGPLFEYRSSISRLLVD